MKKLDMILMRLGQQMQDINERSNSYRAALHVYYVYKNPYSGVENSRDKNNSHIWPINGLNIAFFKHFQSSGWNIKIFDTLKDDPGPGFVIRTSIDSETPCKFYPKPYLFELGRKHV